MIHIEHFSCSYAGKAKPLLEDIHLHIRKGEFVVIIGPSGGGKSTLCYAINGLIPNEMEGSAFKGSIHVDGICVQECYPHDLMSIVGTVLQDPEWQLVRGTVVEELTFALENMGLEPHEIERRLKRVLEQVNLKKLLFRSPLELSGGEKQLVAIAACLMMEPKVLLLDEPTAELDPLGKELVIETINELNRTWGYTVIFVDHNLDVTLPYADRVLVVAEGRIVADQPPTKLYADPELARWIYTPQVVELAHGLSLQQWIPPAEEDPLTVRQLLERMDVADLSGMKPAKREKLAKAGNLSAGSPFVELRHVMFSYNRNEDELTIKPMNLQIHSGEFCSLIGHNGAGKSTLCKLMVGLLKPASGEVLIHGKPVADYRALDLVRHIGYVFQNPDYQLFQRTVLDEIAFGLKLQKLSKAQIADRVERVTRLLDIEKYINEHPHFLSRGERRRVAIAAMLALEPKMLILDEPTTGLDGIRCREMMDYIRQLWRQGSTILLLTHDMRVVADYVPRTIVMVGGTIRWDGDTSNIFAKVQELARCRITVPPVVQLTEALGWQQPAMTTKEFLEAASRWSPAYSRFGEEFI